MMLPSQIDFEITLDDVLSREGVGRMALVFVAHNRSVRLWWRTLCREMSE